MLQLDHLQSFIHTDRKAETNPVLSLLPVLAILISGLVIILTISPEYMQELNPFTLLLLAICSALPVWALNQFLWWHLGRSVSSELVRHLVLLFDVSAGGKRALSFALGKLMSATDLVRFIPSKRMADLVTVLAIYLGAVVAYFASSSPGWLYGFILLFSVLPWFAGWVGLRWAGHKIDVSPLKEAIDELRHNEVLLARFNEHFERVESMVRARLGMRPDEADATGEQVRV